jgi:hypothetical protein
LPPNGHDLASIVAKELEADLLRFFKAHLAYPNASVKIQWSANFYTTPHHYEGSLDTKIATEGIGITQLEENGVEQQMEMSTLEIGVPSAAATPAITRPGLSGSTLSPIATATESKGRRDVNARVGSRIEFQGGRAASPSLDKVGDQTSIQNKAAAITADLEKGPDVKVHESTIIVPAKENK